MALDTMPVTDSGHFGFLRADQEIVLHPLADLALQFGEAGITEMLGESYDGRRI